MISLSRLIKSQWAPPVQQQNKVISIKVLKHDIEENEPIIESFSIEERNHLIQQAKLEAEGIMEEARTNIDKMYRELSNEKLNWENEKIHLSNQARQIGFDEGIELGRNKGYEEFKDTIDHARQIVDSSKVDYINKIQSSENVILDLGLKVAERILGEHLNGQPEHFLAIVKRALKEAREYREIQLHVHPTQYNFLLLQKDDLLKIFPKETELYIYPDNDLTELSCIIESANGRIDASVDQQLEEIKRKLFEMLESE